MYSICLASLSAIYVRFMRKNLLFCFLFCLGALIGNAQFFDFTRYSREANELPKSVLSNGEITIKNLTFAEDNTLWMGTYRDGMYRWWEDLFIDWEKIDTPGLAYLPINTPGNENYHIVKPNSPYVFFTDYNSFTRDHVGFFRLRDSIKLKPENIDVITTIGFDSAAPVLPPIHDIAMMGDSLMLLATDSGLVITNGIDIWRRRNKDNVANITEWRIDAVTATSKGGIYIASGNQIYRQIGINWERINLGDAPYSLRNTQVKELRTGAGDTIWAVTPKGIAKIHDTTGYSELNASIKPLLNEVKDVAFDSIGNPWIIFELNGGVKFLDESTGKKEWRFINSTNSDLPDEVSCIQSDQNGRIWLGTDENGLFRYQFFTPASVNHPWPAELDLYPSLSSTGEVHLVNHTISTYHVVLTNINGQTVVNETLNNRLDFQLQQGIYLLAASKAGRTFIRKVVVL